MNWIKKLAWLCVMALTASALFAQNGNPCFAHGAPLVGVIGTISGTGLSQIVAAGGTSIYVCSASVSCGSACGTSPTFGLSYGTGTNCGSGTTAIFPLVTTGPNTVLSFPAFVVPLRQALCVNAGGTSPTQNYTINYVQQ